MRILGTIAGVVNLICMHLAAYTADTQTFYIAWLGATFSGYAILHTLEERQDMGETPHGYRSLAMRIRWDMQQQHWAPGQRLPSVRELAKQHGTTRTTVARAMQILAEEKLVEVVQGRGTYVAGGVRDDRPKDRIAWELIDQMKDQPTGTNLPASSEIMRRYGVSHPTVRRVHEALVKGGHIRPRPNGGYEKA